MKSLNIISLFAILLGPACMNTTSEPYNYECSRPADIPETYKSGNPIPWDCEWNAYYKEGLLTVVRDSSGDPIALLVTKKASK